MKYTTEELIFASHVRELASSLRHADYLRADSEWEAAQPPLPGRRYNPKTDEEHAGNLKIDEMKEAGKEFKRKWHAEHPVRSYSEKALNLIVEMADEIHRLRG